MGKIAYKAVIPAGVMLARAYLHEYVEVSDADKDLPEDGLYG